MKINITPVPAWPKPIVAVDIFSAADDLSSSATFNFIPYADDGTVVGQSGQVVLSGEDYAAWDGSNDAAIKVVLEKLGFVPNAD